MLGLHDAAVELARTPADHHDARMKMKSNIGKR
jgi:hypothetical protein